MLKKRDDEHSSTNNTPKINTNNSDSVPTVPGVPPYTEGAPPILDDLTGLEIANALVAVFNKHLSLPAGAADAMALWTMFSHTFSAAHKNPYLCFTSPIKGCGKTTAMEMLSILCHNPNLVGNASTASIYRLLGTYVNPDKGEYMTLLLDELHTYMYGVSDILKSAHSKRSAFVQRCVGDEYKVKKLSVWMPLVLSRIGRLDAENEDRSIVITMHKSNPAERFRPRDENKLLVLHGELEKWGGQNVEALKDPDPETEGLDSRIADKWRHLFAVADTLGPDWAQRAREAAKQLSGNTRTDKRVLLLKLLKEVFTEDRMRSADICEKLNDYEYDNDGEGEQLERINQLDLAKLLRPFGIAPKEMRIGGSKERGYKKEWFKVVFATYL
jgi:hypothetical protein